MMDVVDMKAPGSIMAVICVALWVNKPNVECID